MNPSSKTYLESECDSPIPVSVKFVCMTTSSGKQQIAFLVDMAQLAVAWRGHGRYDTDEQHRTLALTFPCLLLLL